MLLLTTHVQADDRAVKVIEKELGSGKAVSLVFLAPPEWAYLPDPATYNTRLCFVETKTGREILDLGKFGFSGFTSTSPEPRLHAKISQDRKRAAVVMSGQGRDAWMAFDIQGTKVSAVEFKPNLADLHQIIREQCRDIRPEQRLPDHRTLNAAWEGNEVLRMDEVFEVGFRGDPPAQKHQAAVRSRYHLQNGAASPPALSMLVDGKEAPMTAFTQVAKVVEAGLGSSKAVSLVLLGPQGWEKVPESDSDITRLAFVETKTGRVIRDLGERGFCGFNGQARSPEVEAKISPDNVRLAVVVQWLHGGDWALFEIKGTVVSEVKLEHADFREVVRGRYRNIRPEGRFLRNIGVSASWDATVLVIEESRDIGFTGEAPEQVHDVTLSSAYHLENGQGSKPALQVLLDGKTIWEHAKQGQQQAAYDSARKQRKK